MSEDKRTTWRLVGNLAARPGSNSAAGLGAALDPSGADDPAVMNARLKAERYLGIERDGG